MPLVPSVNAVRILQVESLLSVEAIVMSVTRKPRRIERRTGRLVSRSAVAIPCLSVALLICLGCAVNRSYCPAGSCNAPICSPSHLRIESPKICDKTCDDASGLLAGPPPTLRDFEQLQPWDLTLEEAVHMTLNNAQVLNRIGGVAVSSPQAVGTIYDPAIQATDPRTSSEAALADFDGQYQSSILHGHDEQRFNNVFFGGGVTTSNSYSGSYLSSLSKTAATGAQFTASTSINYSRNNSTFNLFPSAYTIDTLAQVRQPLLRNPGTAVNRIAGPNAVPGVYNGVVIARIREDISLTDFEGRVRDLVRDTVRNYWELYFAYQDLATKKEARDAAVEVWKNRKARLDSGIGRPDDEAQARQQYFSFQNQVENALMGSATQPGVYGAERQLRRLMGLPTADGRLIRPITEPTVAEVLFDWSNAQGQALDQRVELRRQKWLVRERELELCAAKNLALWRVDLVGQYGNRGFGDRLWGKSSIPLDGAIQELFGGELDNWQFGFEIQGPVGNRLGHLGVRSAQLNLCREKALLREQQRQILHDLGSAYAEVDRSFAAIKTVYNNRVAVKEELEPKRKRVIAGEDDVFFLLEAQQRAANIESAMHRAVVDYNLSLLNFAYAEGNLLQQFNVDLCEGRDAVNISTASSPGTPVPTPTPDGNSPVKPAIEPPANNPAPDRPTGTAANIDAPRRIPVDNTGRMIISIPPMQ